MILESEDGGAEVEGQGIHSTRYKWLRGTPASVTYS